jgi:uncharacterized integral membrane protein
MRYVYTGLIALLAVAVLVFSLQNLGQVTIFFLTMSATLPVALVVILVYIMGMATGGFMTTLLQRWIERARAERP